MKAIYICFIYVIHIFIVYWLVKRFLEKSRNSIVNIIVIILIVFDWCIQHVQCAQNGAFIVRRACVVHKRAITARIIYALEKTIYGLKRLFMAWKDYLRVEKDYLRVEKDYLRLWSSFCRIVSLFLITWHTFNHSMDKNIWTPYIYIYIHIWIGRANQILHFMLVGRGQVEKVTGVFTDSNSLYLWDNFVDINKKVDFQNFTRQQVCVYKLYMNICIVLFHRLLCCKKFWSNIFE